MPVQVEAEVVGGGPVGLTAPHPGDALGVPALHLHDMGDGMHRPGVRRVAFHRHAAVALAPDVAPALHTSAKEGDNAFCALPIARSEERRVGKEWVSTFRSRGSPYH